MSWTRGDSPFDLVLGKYQVRNILECARSGSLLDLGCNDGWITGNLVSRGKFSVALGVDSDEGRIEQAKRLNYSAEYLHSPIEDFTTEERFDTITLINVLEHVEDPPQALRVARDLLAPNGVIIIHVPNALGLNRRLGYQAGIIQDVYELSEADRAIGHRRAYDQGLLRMHIRKARLHLQEKGGVMLKPFSSAQMQRIANEWADSERIFEGLYEMAKELPDYSSPIWAVCTR